MDGSVYEGCIRSPRRGSLRHLQPGIATTGVVRFEAPERVRCRLHDEPGTRGILMRARNADDSPFVMNTNTTHRNEEWCIWISMGFARQYKGTSLAKVRPDLTKPPWASTSPINYGRKWSSSSSPPKSESCPMASFLLMSTYWSTADSWMVTRARRRCFISSKAPALINDSMTRLLHTRAGTLAMKSLKSSNRPLSRRADTMPSTTLAPTLRTAVRPKRMSVPTGVKLASEELTSGGRTWIFIRRHSLR